MPARVRTGLVFAALVLTACARVPVETTSLVCTATADGGARLEVTGADGVQVAVVANRAWRGADELHPGLFGQRCPSRVEPELERAGAGVLLLGVIQGGRLIGDVPAARLATLPRPLVLQPLVSRAVDGNVRLSLGTAWSLLGEPTRPQFAPFAASTQLAAAAGDALCFGVLPLVLLVWLGRSRAPWLRRAGLVVAGTGVLVGAFARLGEPTASPWPMTEPQEAVLERAYGRGFEALLTATRTARRPGEALAVLVEATRRSEQQSLAMHLRLLLGDVRITDDDASVRDGLCLVLANRSDGTRPELPPRTGTRLATTGIGELWRLGAR